MPYQLRIKRSEVSGAVPANLGYGELAYNFADGVLYIGDREGNPIVVASTDQIPQLNPQPEPPAAPARQPEKYTTNGVRRRLLPFE